jgi:hypothetical protein
VYIENLMVARVSKTFHAFCSTLSLIKKKYSNAAIRSNPKSQEFSVPHYSVLLAELSKPNPFVQDCLSQSALFIHAS